MVKAVVITSLREKMPAKAWVCTSSVSTLTRAGMSSLDPQDAVADFSSLNAAQMKTLDQWESFFEKVRP